MNTVANAWRLAWSSALAVLVIVGRLLLVLLAVVPVWLARALRKRRPPAPSINWSRAGRRPRVLFIGGTINHTTQVEQIAAELTECDVAFTWYHADGVLEVLRRLGCLLALSELTWQL